LPVNDPDDFYPIAVSDLRTGMFIRIKTGWLNHPFPTNAFLLTQESQLAELRGLDIDTVLTSPSMSINKDVVDTARTAPDVPAADAPSSPAAASAHITPDRPTQATTPAKAATTQTRQAERGAVRSERIRQQRAAFIECERNFNQAADAVQEINRTFSARPAECRQKVSALAESMMASVVRDRDVLLTVVGDNKSSFDSHFHGVNVAVMAMILGRQLGLDETQLTLLGQAAILHDIGKTRIPDKVTRKLDPLTHAEREFMHQHPVYGAEICRDLGLPKEIIEVILQHHEHIDGTGYPFGLSGQQISQLSRIVSVVNNFDDLCNPPNPARALTPYEALAQMFARQRAHFDISILTTFIRSMGVYPPGSLVRLSNNTTAMVFSVNAGQPLKPTVLVYDPAVKRAEALLLDLESVPDLNVVKNLRASQLTPEELAYLAPRKRITYYFDEVADTAG
jgi:putative nucleotidyltransferase with HDIG domain